MSRQQSNKSGVRSTAQKTDDARHDFEPIPATSPVDGASGGHQKSGRTVEEVTGDYIDEKMQEQAQENAISDENEANR